MAILLGASLWTLSVAIIAFVVGNTFVQLLCLVATFFLVFLAICFEGTVLNRIRRLEEELEKLKRSF